MKLLTLPRIPRVWVAVGNLCALSGIGIALILASTACGTNTTIGTQTSGPVTIATDKSIYQPQDSMQVTVRNSLSTTIYALDTQASCSILSLEILVGQQWTTASVAHCPLGRPAMLVAIAAGQTYSTTIQAAVPGINQAVFPTGTYRLSLNYTTQGTPTPTQANWQRVFSALVAVNGSGNGGITPPSSTVTPTIVPPPSN